jgi:hypothetical protein
MFLAASDWGGFSGRVGRARSRNSTTQVADLRAQFADLRAQFADLRAQFAEDPGRRGCLFRHLANID